MKSKVILTNLFLTILLWSCDEEPLFTSINSLVVTSTEPPGDNCQAQGIRIDSGIDANDDGTLSEDEIDNTQYICGSLTTLMNTADESPGTNCANGGLRLSSGIDLNANGTLEEDEVTETRFICNSFSSLSTTTPEAAGSNCSTGGVRIDMGTDNNSNGVLDSDEISQTQYVCNGNNGTGGSGGDLMIRLQIGHRGSANFRIATTHIDFEESRSDTDRLNSFSKLDYPGVDSIVFAMPLWTDDAAVACIAQLYDATNDAAIINIQSNASNHDGIYTTVYSGNIYDLLPSDGSRIDLANRIASGQEGTQVRASVPSSLLLFRRN